MPHYMGNYPALTPASVQCEGKTGQCPGLVGVTSLNCSGARGCKFSGLTMISASGYEGAGAHVPAVRVWDGDCDSVTILSSQITGASDVLDGDNVPVGSWVSRSGGGFTMVGTANNSATGNAQLTASGPRTAIGDWVPGYSAPGYDTNDTQPTTVGHGLLLGESGETHARLAIETSGAMRWGSGSSPDFHTTLLGVASNTTEYDLGSVDPGGVVKTTVNVEGAKTTDVVTATLSSLGEASIFVSARVSSAGRVLVLFKNEDKKPVKVAKGTLRVLVSKLG